MKIIRTIINLHHQFRECVLTLGNFDGVHLGHKQLITRLVEKGKALNLPSVVMLFEPQPLEFFAKDRAPARLTSFQEKIKLIEQLGVDYLLAIPFTETFAALDANDFIQKWLIDCLHARYVIIGDDFHFGKGRLGSVELLRHYANGDHLATTDQPPFMVESMPTFLLQDIDNGINGNIDNSNINNEITLKSSDLTTSKEDVVEGVSQQLSTIRISSTAVREALQANNFALVKRLLGRPYTIEGRVIHGNALARTLGFPTANILLHRKKPALQGVYLVKVRDLSESEGGKNYYGVANIGFRPTVDGKTALLEVNIFDFSDEIYGHYLAVEFIEKLRDEQKFSSLDALKAQIAQDVLSAKSVSAKLDEYQPN
ncbi:bifunctional riboflavin kinase/FAD synthetase [Orbaceae bacterium ESL0721]|nr:bifunctional riboflavin kinase/FAD synthetase [Orbaceae bacterium ESL0721]